MEKETVITREEITAIKGEKMFNNFKVKRKGEEVFSIIGFHYGAEEVNFTGLADATAEYLNGFFGNR